MKKKADKHYRFYVGSLIDEKPSDYVAICNQYGEVIGHKYGALETTQEAEPEIVEPVKDKSQLNLF